MSDKTILRPRPGTRSAHNKVMNGSIRRYESSDNRLAQPVLDSENFKFDLGCSNLLVSEAYNIFVFVAKIRQSVSADNCAVLKKKSEELLEYYKSQLVKNNVDNDKINSAHYAMCSFIDEAILNSNWSDGTQWSNETLLVLFHNESQGGERFFKLLEKAEKLRDIHLIELLYYCMSLGFSGKYRLGVDGESKKEIIRKAAFNDLVPTTQIDKKNLIGDWRTNVLVENPANKTIPLWVMVSIFSAVVMTVYVMLNMKIKEHSLVVTTQIDTIAVKQEAISHDTALKKKELLYLEASY